MDPKCMLASTAAGAFLLNETALRIFRPALARVNGNDLNWGGGQISTSHISKSTDSHQVRSEQSRGVV